jgi:hypothetical protein
MDPKGEPKVEPKQKLENAFLSTSFRRKLINLTAKVLKNPAMMEHVNKLTDDPELKADFADIKADIARVGIDPPPRAEIPEPLPTLLPMPEAVVPDMTPANPLPELEAGRVMILTVEQEYAKSKAESRKKNIAVEKARKAAAAEGAGEAAAVRVAELEQELSAAHEYDSQFAEIRATLKAVVDEAEITVGAANGVLPDAEMVAVRKKLEVATNNARTGLNRLKAERPLPAMGGRNRRTKKTNYYRKRRRTTRNRSRRNLN